ncbi:MAG TPA: delta-60 repeat domain-containing protein, partial [Spirochaetota bacterium]|nr:delta-60 repeat domain-containing protein [Spirochaetota bacterium]
MVGPNCGYGVPINTGDGKPAVNLPTMPKVNGTILCAIPDGNGGWYIGGNFTKIGTVTRNHIARINSDGSLHTWNPDANNPVFALAISGSIVYAGGTFTSI